MTSSGTGGAVFISLHVVTPTCVGPPWCKTCMRQVFFLPPDASPRSTRSTPPPTLEFPYRDSC